MGASKRTPDSWREALKFINKCPICQGVYASTQAELFAKNEDAYLVHITCEQCQSYFIAMVVMLGGGLSSVGMVTDLSLEDAKRVYQTEPITLNEALSGYKMLGTARFHNLILNDT
jgi:hypothetical protein